LWPATSSHSYDKYDVLSSIKPGGVFLLNAPYDADTVWDHLPREVQQIIIERQVKFFVIDARKVAQATGMGGRVNTVMQTCFFAVSGVLPHDEAIAAIKRSIKKAYGKRGDVVVQRNFAAVDQTLQLLSEVDVAAITSRAPQLSPLGRKPPQFLYEHLPHRLDRNWWRAIL
jgi:pyruvate-ferredoxin/flavodoxin oxidoreductase